MAKKKTTTKKTKKKTSKPAVIAAKKTVEKPVKKTALPAPKKSDKVNVTPALRRLWIGLRKSYNLNYTAFSNALSALNDEQANQIYDFVITALFMDNIAEILSKHPELKDLIRTDDDRICMHDIYENLSWKLGRKETIPKEKGMIIRFRQSNFGKITP
ncbi:hypothetical protein KKE92_05000 [Candidatus Micrarchaeota archaeon]|nr:hypothetical protein [Candidatus Micrarchaeota archaeon]MBU1682052.1 hypothetical protein [Candidatus Micrarchaeota archaeon]